VTKDGRILDVWLTVTKLVDATGKPIGVASTERDITERKLAEKHILRLNRVYAVLGNINAAIVRIREPHALFEEACRIAVEDGGFCMAWIGLADPANKKVLPVAHAGVMDGYLEKLDVVLGDDARGHGPTGNAIRTGTHMVCNDLENDPRMASWREDALRNGYRATATFPLKVFGKVRGAFGLYVVESNFFDDDEIRLLDELAMDIGFAMEVAEKEEERERAEESVQDSEARYRMLFEEAQDGMALADAETGRLVECNHALCLMVERKKEELAGQLQSILHPLETDTGKLSQTFQQHQSMDPGRALEDCLLSKSGKRIPVEIRAARLQMKGRNYLLGIFRDITDRRKAEEERVNMLAQLVQSQKLESIGTLAGGVAHEINNPINGIMNYARLISDKLSKDDPIQEYATEIVTETERVATIVRNLLQFARQEEQSHSPARMVDIVNAVLLLIRTILQHDQIEMEVNVPEDLPMIKCRSQQIQQVIMNLLTNSRDTLNEKYPGHHEDKIIRITAQETADHWIRFTVEDHGTGVSTENRERVFDPFFTTKPKSKGTGLGLSISHTIVEDHGGELNMESEPGCWTRFHVDLPVYEESRG
jgi:PAS domain S-box-containing protein